jgi:hypothetical protein
MNSLQSQYIPDSFRFINRHVWRCRHASEYIIQSTKPRQGKEANLPRCDYTLIPHKPPRYHVDRWEEMMMRRDERLTGHRRGQSVRALAGLVHNTRSFDTFLTRRTILWPRQNSQRIACGIRNDLSNNNGMGMPVVRSQPLRPVQDLVYKYRYCRSSISLFDFTRSNSGQSCSFLPAES